MAVSQFPVVLFDKFYYLTSWSYYLPVVLDWVCSHVKAETCDSQSAACLSPWCRVARTPPQWCEEVFLSCIVWWAPKTTGTAGAMRVGVQKPENMAFWSLSTVANAQLLVTVCEAWSPDSRDSCLLALQALVTLVIGHGKKSTDVLRVSVALKTTGDQLIQVSTV